MTIPCLTELNIEHKRLLIREDFNVPMHNGVISSDARIRAALPTIQYALQKKATVILISHWGRPQEGTYDPAFSLAAVADRLSVLLAKPVKLALRWIDGLTVQPGEIVLCENVRFEQGEKANDPDLSKKIAKLGDIFVMDAFATAHRAEASTVGVAQFSTQVCVGLLFNQELSALKQVLENPKRPWVAIVGGAKVSTKLSTLRALIKKVDTLIVGGGIANTFLYAKNLSIGNSLYEPDYVNEAKALLNLAKQRRVLLLMPSDVIVSNTCSATAKASIKKVADILNDEMILDIGPQSMQEYSEILKSANTILWSGPLGVFEMPAFEAGTKALALAIADSKAYSLAGGGDTLAAIEKYNVTHRISYISTGGSAFLAFVEKQSLPVIRILQERSSETFKAPIS